jgi:hypothetical protein
VQDYRQWGHLVAAMLRGGFIVAGVAKVGLRAIHQLSR